MRFPMTGRGLPTVVKNILIINGIVFLAQLLWSDGSLADDLFALPRLDPSFRTQRWQPLRVLRTQDEQGRLTECPRLPRAGLCWAFSPSRLVDADGH